MEVTKDNYELIEPIIMKDIENADFISLDLELTGINPYSNHILDYPEARYTKYKQTAEKYRIIQLGVCTWHKAYDHTQNKYKYVARPYNIYVFPEDNVGNSFLNCETGAIIFNRDHGMDFNKWIHKGIPYMNVKQENNFLDTISDGNVNFYNPSDPQKFKNISLFKEEDRTKYNDFCKIFSEFLYSEHKSWMFDKYPKYFIYYIMNNLSENMRKRLFFSNEKLEGKFCLMISKLDDDEKKIKIEEILSTRTEEVNKKKGVKRLFEAIVRRKSVLVGHNFNLDVLFIISHFGDPLPPNLKEYKELLKKYFSHLYDTKYLFENLSQKYKEMQLGKDTSTNLENIYTHLKSLSPNLNLSIEIHEDMGNCYNSESTSYHEASFDAYVTGCAFLWMTQLTQDSIELLSNRIYLMKSIYSCINLNADENYAIPDTMAYCLKATKQTSDITLELLLEAKHYERIKKIYNLDYNNALLILVNLENAEILNEFELLMTKFNDKFEFYHLSKFKQILKEDENKKLDVKKDKHK